MYFVCMCVNMCMCLWPPHCVSVTLRQQLGGASFLGSESIFADIKRRWQCLTAAGGNNKMEYNTIQWYLHNLARVLLPFFWAVLPLFSDFRSSCTLFALVFTLHSALQMFPLFVCFMTFLSYFFPFFCSPGCWYHQPRKQGTFFSLFSTTKTSSKRLSLRQSSQCRPQLVGTKLLCLYQSYTCSGSLSTSALTQWREIEKAFLSKLIRTCGSSSCLWLADAGLQRLCHHKTQSLVPGKIFSSLSLCVFTVEMKMKVVARNQPRGTPSGSHKCWCACIEQLRGLKSIKKTKLKLAVYLKSTNIARRKMICNLLISLQRQRVK